MYKNAKHPFIRIGGWIVMGFLTVVIIISFGMPDFLSRMNMDQNVAAVVNGKQIQIRELTRYMKRAGDTGEDAAQTDAKRAEVLNALIRKKLQVQYAAENGIKVSDENVTATIRRIFTDDTGRFNDLYYKRTLETQMMSTPTFFSEIKDELAMQESLKLLFGCGVGASKDEILFRNAIENAAFQVRYAFVSNDDLKKRLRAAIAVSDAEIDEEMSKNKKEIKDPATDRERFKTRVLDRKLEAQKAAIAKSVDEIAAKEGTFDSAAALLGGKTAVSDTFKPGDPIKEPGKDAKPVYSLSESDIFRSDFAALKPGVASRAVTARDGIYVFMPVKKDISFEAPKDEEKAADQIRRELSFYVESAMYKPYFEKARIIRNLKAQAE